MEQMVRTKPNISVLRRDILPISPFALLSQAFTDDILERFETSPGFYPMYELALLQQEEGQGEQVPESPRLELQLQLKMILQQLKDDTASSASARILERVQTIHLEREKTVIHRQPAPLVQKSGSHPAEQDPVRFSDPLNRRSGSPAAQIPLTFGTARGENSPRRQTSEAAVKPFFNHSNRPAVAGAVRGRFHMDSPRNNPSAHSRASAPGSYNGSEHLMPAGLPISHQPRNTALPFSKSGIRANDTVQPGRLFEKASEASLRPEQSSMQTTFSAVSNPKAELQREIFSPESSGILRDISVSAMPGGKLSSRTDRESVGPGQFMRATGTPEPSIGALTNSPQTIPLTTGAAAHYQPLPLEYTENQEAAPETGQTASGSNSRAIEQLARAATEAAVLAIQQTASTAKSHKQQAASSPASGQNETVSALRSAVKSTAKFPIKNTDGSDVKEDAAKNTAAHAPQLSEAQPYSRPVSTEASFRKSSLPTAAQTFPNTPKTSFSESIPGKTAAAQSPATLDNSEPSRFVSPSLSSDSFIQHSSSSPDFFRRASAQYPFSRRSFSQGTPTQYALPYHSFAQSPFSWHFSPHTALDPGLFSQHSPAQNAFERNLFLPHGLPQNASASHALPAELKNQLIPFAVSVNQPPLELEYLQDKDDTASAHFTGPLNPLSADRLQAASAHFLNRLLRTPGLHPTAQSVIPAAESRLSSSSAAIHSSMTEQQTAWLSPSAAPYRSLSGGSSTTALHPIGFYHGESAGHRTASFRGIAPIGSSGAASGSIFTNGTSSTVPAAAKELQTAFWNVSGIPPVELAHMDPSLQQAEASSSQTGPVPSLTGSTLQSLSDSLSRSLAQSLRKARAQSPLQSPMNFRTNPSVQAANAIHAPSSLRPFYRTNTARPAGHHDNQGQMRLLSRIGAARSPLSQVQAISGAASAYTGVAAVEQEGDYPAFPMEYGGPFTAMVNQLRQSAARELSGNAPGYPLGMHSAAAKAFEEKAEPQTMQTLDLLSQPQLEQQISWQNPYLRSTPSEITYRQKKAAPDQMQHPPQLRMSDAEIRRTADKVFKLVQEKIITERRRSGRA